MGVVREAREVQVVLTRGSSSIADTILGWKREGEGVTAGLGVTSSSTGAILDAGLELEGAGGRCRPCRVHTDNSSSMLPGL